MRLTRSTRRSFSAGLAAILPVFGLAENAFSLPDRRPTGMESRSQGTDFMRKGASTEISPRSGWFVFHL